MPRTARLLILSVLAAACADGAPTGESPAAPAAAVVELPASAREHRDLATLRSATARFHRFGVAEQAGWDRHFPTGCFESSEGGMGVHYINDDVASLDPAAPHLLVYEPQRDGTLKLVAVEFLGPGGESDPPPVLFGREFGWNAQFQVWVLHVWAWQHNPSGLYANYNPTVTCAWAADAPAASHH